MKCVAAFLLGLGMLCPTFGADSLSPRVVGSWSLNLKASHLPAEAFPVGLKSENRSYYLREDGYLVVLAVRVYGNGVPDFIQIAVKSDGKDYPQYQSVALAELQINGTRTPLTYSEIAIDENTTEIVSKRNGQVLNKGTRRLSRDGKVMTVNVEATLPDGKAAPIVLVFERSE